MHNKMTKRYIDKVVEYLPLRDRRKARTVINGMIHMNLEEYTDGHRPTNSDVRAVLREMGRPRELANAYYEEFHQPLLRPFNIKKVLAWIMRMLSALALVLVSVGVVGLIFGTANMGCMVSGTILGVLVVLYQMAVAPSEKYVIHDVQQ